jgi:hypothetical protein
MKSRSFIGCRVQRFWVLGSGFKGSGFKGCGVQGSEVQGQPSRRPKKRPIKSKKKLKFNMSIKKRIPACHA